MTDIPVLEGPEVGPIQGESPKKLIVLLHGVGADGEDMIGLAPHFHDAVPDAVIVAPNAPDQFDLSPLGFQWFSLQDFNPETALAGARAAAPALETFIDAKLKEYGLGEADMALVGFSQGATMALHVGVRRRVAPAGIVGFSGMLVGEREILSEVSCDPKVLLIHGVQDQVVPIQALAVAAASLQGAGLEVEAHARQHLDHGIDSEGIALAQAFLEKAFAGP